MSAARAALAGAFALAAALVLPCDRKVPAAPLAGLSVEIGGCAAVAAPLRCEIGADTKLFVWVKTEGPAAVEVAVDEQKISDRGTAIDGGTRFEVAPGAAARMLVVTTAARGGARDTYLLPLAPIALAPEIQRAEKIRKKSPAEAKAIAAGLAASPDARTSAAARGILARIRLAEGEADAAVTALRESAAEHVAAGWPSEALKDELAAAHTAFYQLRDLPLARDALDRARDLAGRLPSGRERVRYYEGLFARETGDLRTAWAMLESAIRGAERVNAAATRSSAQQVLAFVAQMLGREAEGERVLLDAEAAGRANDDACAQAEAASNLGWFWARSETGRGRATEALQRGLAFRARCPNLAFEVSSLTDLAWVLAANGERAEAASVLDRARQKQPDPAPRTRAFWLDIEGQLAFAAGRHEAALAAYERLAALGSAGLLPEAAWRGALGRARALGALGRDVDAAAAFDAAEAQVASAALSVPAGDERGGFLDRLAVSAKSAVEHFATRDPGKAAAVARRAIGRMFALVRWQDRMEGLDPAARRRWEAALDAYRRRRAVLEAGAGAYWKLSQVELDALLVTRRADEEEMRSELDRALGEVMGGAPAALPSIDPAREGEVHLVYFPGETSWFGFACTRDGVRAQAIRLPEPHLAPDPARDDAFAAALLEPFRDAIASAATLAISAPGALADVDFHALPWNGEPLLAAVPIVYALGHGAEDAEGGPEPHRAPATGHPADKRSPPSGRALVVADAAEDLPAARREAGAVTAALRARALDVRALVGREATRADLVRALAEPLDLLHFAGHGRFRADRVWESALPLADGAAFTLADIVALGRAPSLVVLSGCDTAAANERAGARSLGLGQAFVAAGARAVVAASRPVSDTLALRVAEEMYRTKNIGDDVAERVRAAVLAARRAEPAADWAAFRVLVP